MQNRVTWGGYALLFAGALGCGPGEDISLGSETQLRVLGDGGSTPDDDASVYPPSPDAGHCTADVECQMAIDFRLDVATPACPPGSGCQLDIEQIVPADDGTLWVHGTRLVPSFDPSFSYAWLAHIDADGGLLGTTEIMFPESSAKWSTELAVDDRGQAWLASWDYLIGPNSSTRTRIQRFDQAVHAIGEPIQLDDWTRVRMRNAPGRGVAIAGPHLMGSGHEVALLNADGEVQWTRTESKADWLATPAVDSSGRILIASSTLSASTGAYFDKEYSRGPVSLAAYDVDGAPLWSRYMVREVSGTSLDWSVFALMSDAQGGLTLAASGIIDSSFLDGYVVRLDSDGSPQWLWKLPSLNTAITVQATTGRVFGLDADDLMQSDDDPSLANKGAITAISADGTSCRKYGYTDINFLNHLASSAAGELFFAGGQVVGRFHPVDP